MFFCNHSYNIKWCYEEWVKFLFWSLFIHECEAILEIHWLSLEFVICSWLLEHFMTQFKFRTCCVTEFSERARNVVGKLLKSVKIQLHLSLTQTATYTHKRILSHFFLWVLVIWQWPSGSFSSICVGLTHFSPRPCPTVPCSKHMCGGRGISEPSPRGTRRHTLQIWHWTVLSCLSASHSICHHQYWPRGFTP